MGLKRSICTTAQLVCKFQTHRAALLVLCSHSALEMGFKGTVTFTLQKMLLSTEQQKTPLALALSEQNTSRGLCDLRKVPLQLLERFVKCFV